MVLTSYYHTLRCFFNFILPEGFLTNPACFFDQEYLKITDIQCNGSWGVKAIRSLYI